MAANTDTVTQYKPAFDVSHCLVMTAYNTPALHQIARLSRLAWFKAHHHNAHVSVVFAYLHGEIGDTGGLSHTGHTKNSAIGIVVNA